MKEMKSRAAAGFLAAVIGISCIFSGAAFAAEGREETDPGEVRTGMTEEIPESTEEPGAEEAAGSAEEPGSEEATEPAEEPGAEEAAGSAEEPGSEEATEPAEEPGAEEAAGSTEEPGLEETMEPTEEPGQGEGAETTDEPGSEEGPEGAEITDIPESTQEPESPEDIVSSEEAEEDAEGNTEEAGISGEETGTEYPQEDGGREGSSSPSEDPGPEEPAGSNKNGRFELILDSGGGTVNIVVKRNGGEEFSCSFSRNERGETYLWDSAGTRETVPDNEKGIVFETEETVGTEIELILSADTGFIVTQNDIRGDSGESAEPEWTEEEERTEAGEETGTPGIMRTSFAITAGTTTAEVSFGRPVTEEDKKEAAESAQRVSSEKKTQKAKAPAVRAALTEPDWTAGGSGTMTDVTGLVTVTLRPLGVMTEAWFNYGSWGRGYSDSTENRTVRYNVEVNGAMADGRASCVNPNLDGDSQSNRQADKVYEVTAPMLIKAMYYGNNGPRRDVVQSIYNKRHDPSEDQSTGGPEIITHVAIGEIFSRMYSSKTGPGSGFSNTTDLLREDVCDFVNTIAGLETPDDYYAYIASYTGNIQDFMFGSQPLGNGKFYVRKTSTDTGLVYGNTNYSLAGAVYWIYDTEAHAQAQGWDGYLGKLTTKADGTTDTWEGPPGTYYIIEGEAPAGYKRNTSILSVTVKSGKTTSADSEETPHTVSVSLTKTSAEPAVTSGNSYYSLAGAKYGVYKDADCTKIAGTLTTKADGTSNTLSGLALGIYWVKEISAPPGFKKSAEVKKISATSPDTPLYPVTFADEPEKVSLTLTKASANTAITKNNDCYSLAGGKFSVCTDRACTKSVGTLTTKADGTSNTLSLPLGIYYLKETAAPKGYLLNSSVPVCDPVNAVASGKTYTFEVSDTPGTHADGVTIVKKNSEAAAGEKIRTLEGTEFALKYYDGYYSSEADLPESPVRTWVLGTRKASDGSFHAGFDTLIRGSALYQSGTKTVLPLGTFTIKEIKAAPGYINDGDFGGGAQLLIGQVVRSSDQKKTEIRIIKGKTTTANTYEIADTPIPPEIKTAVRNTADSTQLAMAGGKVTLEDRIDYKYLVPGKKYLVTGRLIDKGTANGRPGSGTVMKDAGGKEITARKEFVASQETEGSVTLGFSFTTDASFAGKTLVVYETVTDVEKGEEAAVHADPGDPAQTIYFPGLRTSVLDDRTKLQNTLAGGEQSVTDTVSYENLIPGLQYEVRGILKDRATGKDLKINGQTVTGSVSFKPKAAGSEQTVSGSVKVRFGFDGDGLGNKDLVVYEELYCGSSMIAAHKDPGDEAQTIHIPEGETRAADSKAEASLPGEARNPGEQTALAEMDSVIVDVFSYKNLIPGKEYSVSGKVMDKETGLEIDPLQYHQIDPEGSDTDALRFTPSEKDGSVKLFFRVDASAFAGKDAVIFERCSYDGKDIIIHEDINDEEQVIHYPGGHTLAVSAKTGMKNVLSEEQSLIEDTFYYTNLIPGEHYRITGRVIKKVQDGGSVTGEEIPSYMADRDGNPLEEGFFTLVPQEKDGEVTLYFAADTSGIADSELVIFERVSVEGKYVILHEEITDEAQTTYVPEGKTAVIDAETKIQLSRPDADVTVIDTFAYKNLIPGEEYTVSGKVVNRRTGETIDSVITGAEFVAGDSTDDEEPAGEGDTKISFDESAVTFIPENKDGAVAISFRFDGTALAGEDAVIFERAYCSGAEVIIHENIDDEGQTIHLPDGNTAAADPETGLSSMPAEENVLIEDIFYYKNLIPGQEYTVTGKVMRKPETDAEDPKEVQAYMSDAEGNRIDAFSFIPEQKDGSVELFFVADASSLEGKSAVLFEKVQHEGIDLIIHEDIDDEGQTIHFPAGETTASDSETGTHISCADEEVVLIDEFRYKNLIPGVTYLLQGELIDRDTGEAVETDGAKVTAEETFVPETPDGSLEVTFRFNGGLLAGKKTVIFETLSAKGKTILCHSDPEDKAQQIDFPSLETSAADRKDGDRTISYKGKARILDTVKYENLISGREYRIKGFLTDKTDGKPVLEDGKEITGQIVFTPLRRSGSRKVAFEFDAGKLPAGQYVVFEELYMTAENGEEVLIGEHKDSGEELQTVTRPEEPETPPEEPDKPEEPEEPEEPPKEPTPTPKGPPSTPKEPPATPKEPPKTPKEPPAQPEKPLKRSSPETGDRTFLLQWGLLFAAGLAACVSAAAVSRKKGKK